MVIAEVIRNGVASLERLALLSKTAWHARRASRARTESARRRARAAIYEVLGEARGIALKVGQVNAALQADRDELEHLSTEIPPRPLEELLPVLEAGLNRDLEKVFTEISEVGRAASLGQVHKARLRHTGEPVAVKIRYPNISRVVAAELRLAGLVPGVGPARTWSFDLDGYKRFLQVELERELSYGEEARRQTEFARSVRVRGLVTPRVYRQLCGEGVLVQAWEGGVPLADAAAWSHAERVALSRILIETFLTGLFGAGRVHGDPNPGNVAVRPGEEGEPELVLYDYGCVLELTTRRRLGLLRLVHDLREGVPAKPTACLSAVGFDPTKLAALGNALEPLCRTLCEPLLLDRPFDPGQWRIGERFDALLGDLKWWFRSAGPPDFLLLIRALHGLMNQLRSLDAPLPWWPLVKRAVGSVGLTEARQYHPPEIPEEATGGRPQGEARPRLLKVRVDHAGEEVRSIALPATEARHLDELVPTPVRSRLADEGLDLAALGRELWERGLPTGEVLQGQEGDKSFRVWIE